MSPTRAFVFASVCVHKGLQAIFMPFRLYVRFWILQNNTCSLITFSTNKSYFFNVKQFVEMSYRNWLFATMCFRFYATNISHSAHTDEMLSLCENYICECVRVFVCEESEEEICFFIVLVVLCGISSTLYQNNVFPQFGRVSVLMRDA